MIDRASLLSAALIAGTTMLASLVPSKGPNTIAEGTLQIVTVPVAKVRACTVGTKTVVASVLNVRSRPTTAEPVVIGKLAQGARVSVARCSGNWAEIGKDLWVSSRYLYDTTVVEAKIQN